MKVSAPEVIFAIANRDGGREGCDLFSRLKTPAVLTIWLDPGVAWTSISTSKCVEQRGAFVRALL